MAADPCYREERLYFSNPLFRDIPLTVVLTMEGSDRRESYMRQLFEYRPTAEVIIQHNRGYRRCAKPVWVTNTALDLWHANHVAMRRGGPMLILEDDVQLLPALRELAGEIERFALAGGAVAYSLGSTVQLGFPVDTNHIRMWKGGSAHAVVYSKGGVERAKRLMPRPPHSIMHDGHFFDELVAYAPVRVCALQEHPSTENSKIWSLPGELDLHLARAVGKRWYPLHHASSFLGGRIVVLAMVGVLLILCVVAVARVL